MLPTYDEDTIAAIATPLGEGGIGIVRLSGSRAVAIVQRLFGRTPPHDLRDVPSHTMHHGYLRHPVTLAVLDEVLVAVMRAPHSYTREDVVEINCHGGMLALRNVLEAVLSDGARLATPGEFTKRAFLNGRLDLAQAESVIDIIQAKTEAGLQLALQQLRGKLSRQVADLHARLQFLLAVLEADIDFVEEDLDLLSFEQLEIEIAACISEIERLLSGAREGKIVRDGLTVAIVGKPNVGKSSLLNLLLQEERAIVTALPGTTRDTIEEYLNLHGIPLKLVDTAGIRETSDELERLGVDRSQRVIQQADLVLGMFDLSEPWSANDEDFLALIREKPKIIVLNKCDLPAQWPSAEIARKFAAAVPIIPLSVTQHLGIDELKQTLTADVMARPLESVAVSNVRHINALIQSRQSLLHARQTVADRLSQEFIALDLREALASLGEITGETTTEDILDRIFETFCIGK